MAQSSQSWELFDAFIAQAAAFLGMIAFYLDDLGTENSDIACGSFLPQIAVTVVKQWLPWF